MMNRGKIIIYILTVTIDLVVFGNLKAQPDGDREKPSLRYSSELVSDLNFSTSSINSIAQDEIGFMWFGTWDGLFMYDGYQVRTYKPRPGYQECFRGRKIRVVYNDSHGRLWVGSSLNGLHLLDDDRQCFRQFIHSEEENSIPENDIMAIWEDSEANIWIATTYGYVSKLVISEEKIVFENYYYKNDAVDFLSASVSGDILWLGTSSGVLRFDLNDPGIKGGKGKFRVVDISDDFTNQSIVNAILVDPHTKNTLWLGTIRGVKMLKVTDSGEVEKVQTFYMNDDNPGKIENRIKTIYQSEQEPDVLWIGTDEGAFRLNKAKGTVREFGLFNQQEIDDKVTEFYEDVSGVIWIGTNKGVRKVNKYQKEFNHISISKEQIEASGEVRGMSKDHFEDIYVATHGLGILKVKKENESMGFERIVYDPDNSGSNFINAIGFDAYNNIWAGTDGTGLYKISLRNKRISPDEVSHYQKDSLGLSDDFIYSILSDSDSNLWIGTYQGGLNRYDAENEQFVVYDQVQGIDKKLSDFPIVKLIEDHKGNIWIGTRGGGIYLFKPNTEEMVGEEIFSRLSAEDGLLDNFITDIYEDENHRIWIGTETGLSEYDPSEGWFKSFSRSNGFPADVVQSIQGYGRDELWISTVKGILKMNIVAEEDSSREVVYREYYYSDGLGNDYFNNNAALYKNGILYFGGLNGITYFDPDDIDINPFEPQVAITDFELNHRSVPVGEYNGRTILEKNINDLDEIVLKHSDKVLTFEFSALHYAAPEKNNYAYMMEGFDQDWITTDANRRYAHYTNLSHGEYVFKVKASNNDGVWKENSKSIKVTVLPPFWLTPWAFILYALFITGLLLFIRKITLIRANLKHRIQLERLEREKADELHNIELQYFTNISHEIRTPLTLILSPLEKMLKEEDLSARVSNQLNLMHHHGVRLFRLLNQLLDFRKHGRGKMTIRAAEGDFVKFLREIYISFRESAIDRNISFAFNNSFEHFKLYFDRDILEKIMYNLLSNAFKYTKDNGVIDINVFHQDPDAIKQMAQNTFSEYKEIFDQQYLTVQVKDNGPGISSQDLEHIFERFYRVNNKTAISTVGTGIGLSLTKELVQLHKGILTVESEEKSGTIFSVHLPVGKKHLSEGDIITDFKDSESQFHYKKYTSNKKESDKSHAQNISSTERSKLLLVEDNEDVRNFIKSILQEEYEIIEASNGKIGLDKAIEEVPDLIVSDVMMPEIDGIELCSQIKKDERTSHIPVILLTARTGLIFKVEGIETGADDYITKPFSPDYLEVRIRNLIEQRKRLKKRFSEKLYVKPKDITLNSLDETFLNKIIELVNENMSNSEYGIEDMCKDLGMSRMQLYRKLKALTGQSANEFVRTQRLQRAAQLLQQQQLTIAQVTYEVGFNDLKYFRTRFSEHFGMTPSEYANQYKNVPEDDV